MCIGEGWRAYGAGAAGVVLIALSIGAGIALMVAGRELEWPLLGMAVSGLGLHTPDESRVAWQRCQAMQQDMGHCIDFHHDGAAFQVQQLGFALFCAAQARL